MDRYPLTYLYRVADSQTWTDITSIVDSASTTITQHLCSTSFKSVVDEASFRIPPKDTEMKQNLINALFGDKDIFVQILTGETVRFYGVINRDNISVTSTRLTADVTISCEDISVLHLDDKVKVHVFQENKTITQLVWHLLGLAGYTYDTTKTIRVDEERTLTAFVIDADNSDTFRTYIDDLLFEAGGYVLNFRESGIAEIVRIPWDDSALVKRALGDNKISARGLSTRSSNLTEDGVKLKWSTVATTEPGQTVYLDSINRSVDEEGSLVGEDIVSGGYWPQDGDIVATYQEYSADFLDKPYLIKDSRLQNKDLSIIAVKDISAYIQATNPNGSKFESWTYPVLPSLGMTGNPEIWPTKAWYLLRNDSANTVNIQFFTLRGTVTYRSRINEMLLPSASNNPKEYTSKYIYDEDHAELFSTFYWHFMSNARFVSTWSEVGGGSLGETVRVQHKGNDYLQDVVVVSKETSWVGHTEINDLTGVAVSAYNAYTMSQSSTLTGSKPTSQPGEKGAPGATFTPDVDEDGNISWTNNAGLPNPPTMNIKGPEGPSGSSGRYRGVINANPATAKEGDYYVFGLCGEELERDDEGTIYLYENGEWIVMPMIADNNEKILTAYADIIAKKDDTAYFSKPPIASGTIEYAQTIFANVIVANGIKAIDGFFDNITATNISVLGDSLFQGRIDSPALTTLNGEEGESTRIEISKGDQVNQLAELKAWLDSHTPNVTGSYPVSGLYWRNIYGTAQIKYIHKSVNNEKIYATQIITVNKGEQAYTFTAPFGALFYVEWVNTSRKLTFDYVSRHREETCEAWMLAGDGLFVGETMSIKVSENSPVSNGSFRIWVTTDTGFASKYPSDLGFNYWLSNNMDERLREFNSRDLTITINGSSYVQNELFSYNGMPTQNGYGIGLTDRTNTFHLITAGGVEYNKQVKSAEWDSPEVANIVFTDNTTMSLRKGPVRDISVDFSLARSEIYAKVTDLLPKDDTTDIGSSDHYFSENYLYRIHTGEILWGEDHVIMDKNGKVWGAVFN